MKKTFLKVAALLMVGSLTFSSCIGSFALFNRYEKWQCNMTDVKIVNGIVGLILQPIAGSLCLFTDSLILNTIEFWSGTNPLTSSTQFVTGSDGRNYVVQTIRKGYRITDPDGNVTVFVHDAKTDSWSIKQGNLSLELFRFNEDGTIQAHLQNGEVITVGNDEAGLQQVREAVYNDLGYALR